MTASKYASPLGRESAVPGTTWNPADLSGVTLSNGNRQVANNVDGVIGGVRATLGRQFSRRYYEAYVATTRATGTLFGVGFALLTTSLTSMVGSLADGVTFQSDGNVVYGGATIATLAPLATGDFFGLAIDIPTGTLWVARNGVWQGNPVAGTGGLAVPGLARQVVYPSFSATDQEGVIAGFNQVNFLIGPPPATFKAWAD